MSKRSRLLLSVGLEIFGVSLSIWGLNEGKRPAFYGAIFGANLVFLLNHVTEVVFAWWFSHEESK